MQRDWRDYNEDTQHGSRMKKWVVFVNQHLYDYINLKHMLFCKILKLECGYDIAKWLLEMDITGKYLIPDDFEFNVHSANPIGKENIEIYWNNYLKFRRYQL